MGLLSGTQGAVTPAAIGLGNVDNTSDLNKPISTATQTALDLKAPLASPHLTGAPVDSTITALTSATTITPDFSLSNNFTLTLAHNATLANPTGLVAGQQGSIVITQDATGSRTMGFGTSWKFVGGTAPTLSTAAGAVDRLDYLVVSTTEIHAVVSLDVK